MIVNISIDVDRPRDEVFDAMADARNEAIWNTQVSRTELLSDEPIRAGTRFRTVNRGQSYTATITEYARPDHLTFLVSGRRMDITGDLHFAETGGGTRTTGTFDLQPKGFARVMLPLMSGAVRKDFPRQMASFKGFCEAQPAR
jgi:uncharacterized protein YndB with AHSA1/START domain